MSGHLMIVLQLFGGGGDDAWLEGCYVWTSVFQGGLSYEGILKRTLMLGEIKGN